MPVWLNVCIGVVGGLGLLASPVLAQSPAAGDPCTPALSGTPLSPLSIRSQIRIERDTAVVIAKHVQRACKFIGRLPREAATATSATASRLRLEVLEPIYREYPDLRGRDLTSNQTSETQPRSEAKGRLHSERMGPATAVYLRWTLDEAQRSFLNTPIVKLCSAAKDKECAQSVVDVVARGVSQTRSRRRISEAHFCGVTGGPQFRGRCAL
jgi:hypothetical protein